MKPTLLITGGAGYIGSHTAYQMAQAGYNIIILDTLNHGQSFNHPWATLIQKDYADQEVLHEIFTTHDVQAVMHFAAFIEVGQSVKDPLSFYENNVIKTIRLLESMLKHNVKKMIFSSSCAVYGIPNHVPISESHPKNPISPYGSTKLMVETVLKELNSAHGLQYVALRYFNAAGALSHLGLKEQHEPETHVLPLLIQAAQQHEPFFIFGDNYQTPDGTCIRDFLHVCDIASAHAKAFEYLQANKPSDFFNLGTGKGYSIKEIIHAVEQVMNTSIAKIVKEPRPGDPAVLIADASRAHQCLGWKPEYSDLLTILQSVCIPTATELTQKTLTQKVAHNS